MRRLSVLLAAIALTLLLWAAAGYGVSPSQSVARCRRAAAGDGLGSACGGYLHGRC